MVLRRPARRSIHTRTHPTICARVERTPGIIAAAVQRIDAHTPVVAKATGARTLWPTAALQLDARAIQTLGHRARIAVEFRAHNWRLAADATIVDVIAHRQRAWVGVALALRVVRAAPVIGARLESALASSTRLRDVDTHGRHARSSRIVAPLRRLGSAAVERVSTSTAPPGPGIARNFHTRIVARRTLSLGCHTRAVDAAAHETLVGVETL